MSTEATHHDGDATHEAGHGDAHEADEHGGHGDGHGGTALGPVDVRMWATGLLGVALGLVSAAVFAISTGRF